MIRRIVGCAVLMLMSVVQVRAQNSSALINEALDKLVVLEFNTTLPEALKSIENKTGVPLRAGHDVYDMLPWGEQTNINAKISNQTLRSALTAMTVKYGLDFIVTDETVELRPMAAMARLGRRSTIEELQIIDILASKKLSPTGDSMSIKAIAAAVDLALATDKLPFATENRAGDELSNSSVHVFKDKTLLDTLEELGKQTRATWYPWGRSIVIVPREDQVRMLLNKPLTMRYNGVDVSQVLTELSRRSGIEFVIEPGAVQKVPPESRTIRLVLENVSIKQALESICGYTGLGYVANENGVYIWNQSATPARPKDKVVALLPIEGGMQLVLPEADIPDDVKQYLATKREKAIQDLREDMKKNHFTPTTKPTTRNDDL